MIADASRKFSIDPDDLAWLDDALVEAADVADHRADEAAGDGDDGERKSTADLLVELALQTLSHRPDGKRRCVCR